MLNIAKRCPYIINILHFDTPPWPDDMLYRCIYKKSLRGDGRLGVGAEGFEPPTLCL